MVYFCCFHYFLSTLQQKIKIDSKMTLKSEKKSCNYNLNTKRVYRSREQCNGKLFNQIDESGPFGAWDGDGSAFNRLDFTSSNSTPSAKTFDIQQKSSTTHTVTERKVERKQTEKKVSSTKKPQRIFCKDPNKRLKNLFTIVRPNEKLNEKSIFPKRCDMELLNKTKELLVKLIDKELERVQPDGETNSENPHPNDVIEKNVLKKLRLECMRKIEDELRLMKRLDKL